jgi:hypothetical protein
VGDASCSIEMGFIGLLVVKSGPNDQGSGAPIYARYGSEDLPSCVASEQQAIDRDGGEDQDQALLAGPFLGYFTSASYDAVEDALRAYLTFCSDLGANTTAVCFANGPVDGFP